MHRYTMSKQPESEWQAKACGAGAPVHYEQTVRERVARPRCVVRVHRYTMSKQSESEWPGQGVRYGCTGTL